jgi:competence protein ComEC
MLDRKLPWPNVAFVSHGNADHYTALLDLLDRRSLRTLYVSRHFGLDDPDGGEALLLRKLARTGGELVRLQTGDVVELDERTRVEVLWPGEELPEDLPRRENETSLVLRVVCDNRSVLLPGDAQSFAQTALLSGRPAGTQSGAGKLACDAMLLPHHGSWEATLPRFVGRIDPQIVLASRSGPLPASGQAGSFYADLISTRVVRTTSRDGCLLLRFGYGVLEAVSATARIEP